MSNTTRLGPFVVEEQIGEGGMGRVYRGTHRETEVPVAIKVIHQRSADGVRGAVPRGRPGACRAAASGDRVTVRVRGGRRGDRA